MAGIEGESRCTLCREPIVWRLTLGDRRYPLDAEPSDNGNVIVVNLPDGRIRARVLTGPEMPAQETAYRVHECPRATPPGPRCTVCRGPMDRELALLERWVACPSCEPEYQRECARQAAAIKAGRSRVIYRESQEESAAA